MNDEQPGKAPQVPNTDNEGGSSELPIEPGGAYEPLPTNELTEGDFGRAVWGDDQDS